MKGSELIRAANEGNVDAMWKIAEHFGFNSVDRLHWLLRIAETGSEDALTQAAACAKCLAINSEDRQDWGNASLYWGQYFDCNWKLVRDFPERSAEETAASQNEMKTALRRQSLALFELDFIELMIENLELAADDTLFGTGDAAAKSLLDFFRELGLPDDYRKEQREFKVF